MQVERLVEAERLSGELSDARKQLELGQEDATKKLADCQALIVYVN